jgi:hypothetical protein
MKGTPIRFEHELPEAWSYVRQMQNEPLSDGLRAHLESYFKRSLRLDRIHTGPLAAASARMLNAWAYALGDHVVFGEDEYRPRDS